MNNIRNIRKLRADEIECRVAQVKSSGCSLLLYKTARVDRAILDEVFGLRWQNDFKVIDGKMYGGIGIFDAELKEWLWRWDCGTESNTEAEKGQASDCFKRAGFKFGIGIELYSAPFIWIKTETKQTGGKWKLKDPYAKFEVKSIGYAENGDINKLEIIDNKGVQVYKLGSLEPKNINIEKKQKTSSAESFGEDEEVNSDIDLIQGINSINDIENLQIYYYENVEKVKDERAFNVAINRRKSKIWSSKNGTK